MVFNYKFWFVIIALLLTYFLSFYYYNVKYKASEVFYNSANKIERKQQKNEQLKQLVNINDEQLMKKGKSLLAKHCIGCHKIKGFPNSGKLNNENTNLSLYIDGNFWKYNIDTLFKLILYVPSSSPKIRKDSLRMPNFIGILNNEDAGAIISYLIGTLPSDYKKYRKLLINKQDTN